MKIIKPNYLTVALRAGLLLLFLYMYRWPYKKFITDDYDTTTPGFLLLVVVYSLFPIYLFYSLRNPIAVILYPEENKIKLLYWFRYKTILIEDIGNFHKTKLEMRMGAYDGLILNLNNKKKIRVVEYDVQNVNEVQNFLVKNQIPCIGFRNTLFF
ncbi:hypothetical protein PDL71_04850 [Lacibacter sp. MH-610]|uniref:hypothetical protein n=1 Tax=Lacibacter sp. MH-610 TaxID=3020883 RepID=UPI003892AA7B